MIKPLPQGRHQNCGKKLKKLGNKKDYTTQMHSYVKTVAQSSFKNRISVTSEVSKI